MAEVDYSTGKKPRVNDVKAKKNPKKVKNLVIRLLMYFVSPENSQRVRWTIEEC
jgi:hypothetical protein